MLMLLMQKYSTTPAFSIDLCSVSFSQWHNCPSADAGITSYWYQGIS